MTTFPLDGRWDGRTAVITGAASGIGLAAAHEVSRRGARVGVIDLREDIVQFAVQTIRDRGGLAEGAVANVADDKALGGAITALQRALGDVDLFWSNAGVSVHGGVDVGDAAWNTAWRVNVLGHVHAGRHVLDGLATRGGAFVVTASAAGLLTHVAAAPYAVTKAACVSLAEWIAIRWGDQVAVACVCPKVVRSSMSAAAIAASDQARRVAAAYGRVLEPEAVVAATLDGLAAGRFLILPHEEVEVEISGKVSDRAAWLADMRGLAKGALHG